MLNFSIKLPFVMPEVKLVLVRPEIPEGSTVLFSRITPAEDRVHVRGGFRQKVLTVLPPVPMPLQPPCSWNSHHYEPEGTCR